MTAGQLASNSTPTRLRFPSREWFAALAARMAAQPEKYRAMGVVDITLVPAIRMPDGSVQLYAIELKDYSTARVTAPSSREEITGRHPVIVEGDLATWREMVDNVMRNGGADLNHTLNYLTFPDWPLRLESIDEAEGQLDVDRFYRYIDTLQELFNEASSLEAELDA